MKHNSCSWSTISALKLSLLILLSSIIFSQWKGTQATIQYKSSHYGDKASYNHLNLHNGPFILLRWPHCFDFGPQICCKGSLENSFECCHKRLCFLANYFPSCVVTNNFSWWGACRNIHHCTNWPSHDITLPCHGWVYDAECKARCNTQVSSAFLTSYHSLFIKLHSSLSLQIQRSWLCVQHSTCVDHCVPNIQLADFSMCTVRRIRVGGCERPPETPMKNIV